jgi:hypothetical protein
MWEPFYNQFGSRMHQAVKVCCAYKHTMSAWNVAQKEHMIAESRSRDAIGARRLTLHDYPSVLSADATQGTESDIAILSTAIGGGSDRDQGHCKQIQRCTVLFSRGKLRCCVTVVTVLQALSSPTTTHRSPRTGSSV